MSLGHKLRILREASGMNQKELADKAQLSASLVSRLESEHVSELKVTALSKLAQAFGVSIDSLVGVHQPDLTFRKREPMTAKELAAALDVVLPPERVGLEGLLITIFQRREGSEYVTTVEVKGFAGPGAKSAAPGHTGEMGEKAIVSGLARGFAACGAKVSRGHSALSRGRDRAK